MDPSKAASLSHRERTRSETTRSANDNSKPPPPDKSRSRSSRQRQKVRFTDMEPEPSPLLFHARDSMYMRAELQRELDFGIPAQEEAHRYARWCAEEAHREAAEAQPSITASHNYARADTVVHPKRLSVDLSSMNIDFSNLGEDVSGLDVFSRVEAALGKQQEEKRKQKEKNKKEKKDSRLRATLLAASKWDSSLDESVVQSDLSKEKKGSSFLRKVITNKVIKSRDGSPGPRHTTDGPGPKKMATPSPTPNPLIRESLPKAVVGGGTAKQEPTHSHGISLPRGVSHPSSTSSGSRRPSHPEPHTQQALPKNSNGRPSSKSEPPPLVRPTRHSTPSVNAVAATPSLAPPNPVTKHSTMPSLSTIRAIPGMTVTPTTKPGIHHDINNSSTKSNQEIHHPSQNHHSIVSHLHSSSIGKPPSPPRPMSNGSATRLSQATFTSASTNPSSLPGLSTDDLFSRVEQDIARNHPPLPQNEKAGDEKHRGRKLIGKALHIMHGGEKLREKVERERVGK